MPELWQEECAARMTRFLARPPRKNKTCAYLATLPERKKIVVAPSDYPVISRAMARQSEEAQKIRDAQRYAAWEERGKATPSPSAPRKDRVRPRRGRDNLRERLFHAQEGLCSLCRGQIGSPRYGTIEHVVPRALGGGNGGNRLLAHARCNNQKADSPPTQRELAILDFVNKRLAAQGIEAQRAATGNTDAVACDESPVANGDAPKGGCNDHS